MQHAALSITFLCRLDRLVEARTVQGFQDSAAVEAAAAREKLQAEYKLYSTTATATIGTLEMQLAEATTALTTLRSNTDAATAASVEETAALQAALAEGVTALDAKDM
jgi:chitinase